MTTLEILKNARKLVAKPNGWIKGEYAGVQRGGKVLTTTCETETIVTSKTNCFCAVGALIKAAGSKGEAIDEPTGCLYDALPARFRDVSLHNSVTDWNDSNSRTQVQVVALFDKAITAEKNRLVELSRDE